MGRYRLFARHEARAYSLWADVAFFAHPEAPNLVPNFGPNLFQLWTQFQNQCWTQFVQLWTEFWTQFVSVLDPISKPILDPISKPILDPFFSTVDPVLDPICFVCKSLLFWTKREQKITLDRSKKQCLHTCWDHVWGHVLGVQNGRTSCGTCKDHGPRILWGEGGY